ncbi:MAG: glucosamine-6-phosphate deaminase [Aureliella sp.]
MESLSRMRVVILKNAEEVSKRAAEIVANVVQQKPAAVLGLATGSTPLATYQRLIELYQAGQVSFAQVKTFNLDEYVGLAPSHPQSYHYFMHSQLFEQIDVDPARCHVPDGQAGDYRTYGQQYEQAIAEAGGIDLQLLGIGTDGHIAFNEPGSSLASRTRLKALTEQTRRDNSRFFDSLDQVPKLAISMGVGTILEARQILLLATGQSKADAVRSFIEGPVTSQITASALQLHPDVIVLLDEAAAQWLQRRDYYDEVEAVQRELELQAARHFQFLDSDTV